ncbi:MAG: hypothetical protein R3E83_07850 [Burkholderiaceae bacterium]
MRQRTWRACGLRAFGVFLFTCAAAHSQQSLAEPQLFSFTARLERTGAESASMPGALRAGMLVPGTIELRSASPERYRPSVMQSGRAWARALARVKLGPPFNSEFEGGLVTQANGLLTFSNDPLGGRDYREILASWRASGPPILGQAAQAFGPAGFVIMQRGHPDEQASLPKLLEGLAQDADMLVRYRSAKADTSTLSFVFKVGNLRRAPTASRNH